MLLKKNEKKFMGGFKFLHTTTFRLTIWYLGVFSALSMAVFAIVYIFLTSHLHDNIDREITNSAKEFSTLYREHGVKALQSEFTREAASRGTERVFFELVSIKGNLLAHSDLHHWKNINKAIPKSLPHNFKNKLIFYTIMLPKHKYKTRVVSISTFDGNTIRIGITLKGDEVLLQRYRETIGTALLIMLISGGLIGWQLTRKAMAGIKKITETAIRIGEHDFSRRVELTKENEEIKSLANAFNNMLEHIESLMKELREITDNIAHELRTPITRIRGMAETIIKYTEKPEDYYEMAAMVIEECDNLIEMINTMLEISRTDSGVTKFSIVPVNILEIVKDAADLFTPAADDKNIKIIVLNKSSKAITVNGDRSKLQRVVADILDNAVKYTPSHGIITMSITSDKKNIKITIKNTGNGIEKKDISKIFDRFYRCDKSRSTLGNGLGLSLALAIIRALNGNISVKSTKTETSFTISLPNPSSY